MLGLMQDWPLLCHRIIDHAAQVHGEREVVTRSVEGPIHRTNYAEIRTRALKVAQRLDREGIKMGDRVATIAWNTWRHLESWYGIMGIGAICHTVNPRLFPDQIAWIINHAQDRIVMTDLTFVPILEKLADQLPSVERFVVYPGQATAYTVGKLKIVELRERARKALGPRFDIRAFHDVVLMSGPVPLDVLEENVDAWIAKTRA